MISTQEELKEILPQLPQNYFYRRDSLIGEKFSQRLLKDGNPNNILQYFENMKKSNESLNLLIIESKVKNLPRYISNGAFNIAIKHKECIIIELLGHGFDAREITHGLASHEAYLIPWNQVLFCDSASALEKFATHKVDNHTYQLNYQIRMEYLKKLNFDLEDVKKHFPENVKNVSLNAKEDILNNIVLPIFIETETNQANFDNHWVCGNITNHDELVPFEFSNPERIN